MHACIRGLGRKGCVLDAQAFDAVASYERAAQSPVLYGPVPIEVSACTAVLRCIIKQTSCASVKAVKRDVMDASSNGVACDDWLVAAMGFVTNSPAMGLPLCDWTRGVGLKENARMPAIQNIGR